MILTPNLEICSGKPILKKPKIANVLPSYYVFSDSYEVLQDMIEYGIVERMGADLRGAPN